MANFNDQIRKRFDDIIENRIREIELPWDFISKTSNPLMPGACLLLCGTPGASKSFMLLQALQYWNKHDIKACVYELEEDRIFHMTRYLAQVVEQPKLTNYGWIRDNPEDATKIIHDNEAILAASQTFMHESPHLPPTMGELGKWVLSQAKDGYRVICIDPITIAATESAQSWIEERQFLQQIGRACSKYQCSVVLVTHPKTDIDSKPNLNKLAGSAAYPRFCQTVYWLEYHDDIKKNVRSMVGTTEREFNRTLHVMKARNGIGQGFKVAFDFSSDNLCLHELGLIVN